MTSRQTAIETQPFGPITRHPEAIAPLTSIPFLLMHVAAIYALFIESSWVDWFVCGFLYVLRMFGITAGFHRYFSHRSYQVGRVTQFALAFIGSMSAQKGVLWWAAHHRHHHKQSDLDDDIHSPKRGFWWSHVGWMLSTKYDETHYDKIKDFARYPELVWLNRYWLVAPVSLAVSLFAIGGTSLLFV